MKISLSSAEFSLNSDFYHSLFGDEKFYSSGQLFFSEEFLQEGPKNTKALLLEDIASLKTWHQDKIEISGMYNDSAIIRTDINGNDWVSIGFTGGECLWSIAKE